MPALDPVKPLKQVFHLFPGNSDTPVFYGKCHRTVIQFCLHINVPGVGGVFDGVCQEVDDDLADAVAVAEQPPGFGQFCDDAVFRRGPLYFLHDFLHQAVKVEVLFPHLELARFDFGDIKQVADKDGKFVDLPVHFPQKLYRILLSLFFEYPLEHLGIRLDARDRRFEFMGGYAQEFILLVFKLF